MKRMKTISLLLLFIISGLCLNYSEAAQEKAKDPPPAVVHVAKVTKGQVAPQADFIGTVFYQEVSDVASESAGLVETVQFEEGQRVAAGDPLVELNTDIRQKRLQATVFSYEQILADLEIARLALERKEKLYRKKSVSEQAYDEDRFRVMGTEKKVASLKAQVEEIQIEIKKATIRAPFSGAVIRRHVDRGEWLTTGQTIAVLAKDDVLDIVCEIPERFITYISPGITVTVSAGGREFEGRVHSIVGRGDIATRTIPVKVRVPNRYSLIEGMSARITLPTGNSQNAFFAPRDAVISKFGQAVVYIVSDSRVKMVPVEVVGYDGSNAGLQANPLQEGDAIVVKGNERLRDGQAVTIAE